MEEAVLSHQLCEEKDLHYSELENCISTLKHNLKTHTLAQIRALEYLFRKDTNNLTQEQKELLMLTLQSSQYQYEIIKTLITPLKF